MRFSKPGGAELRRWSRAIHRDLSYFFAGMVMIYAVSGIAMNHRDTFNPDYAVERRTYRIDEAQLLKPGMSKEEVLQLLAPLGEADRYTKHYYPTAETLKVFLRGGSSLVADLPSRQACYERLSRRPVLGALTRLHYNPGRWWTRIADLFAAGLLVITFTGLVMVKGSRGLWGRGGIELAAGIALPLLFLFL